MASSSSSSSPTAATPLIAEASARVRLQSPVPSDIVQYSDKAIAVLGDTFQVKDVIKALGGKWNARLTYEGTHTMGWILPATKRRAVEAALGLGRKAASLHSLRMSSIVV